MGLQIELREASHVIATFESVFVSLWWDQGTVERLSQLREIRRRFAARRQGGLATFTLIRTERPKSLSREVRQLSQEITRELSERFVGEATVIESSSLVMGAGRLLFSGINLFVKPRYPTKIFGDAREAIAWLAPLAGVDARALGEGVNKAIGAREGGALSGNGGR